MKNKKFEKALKYLEEIRKLLRLVQYQSPAYVLILKQIYTCLVGMGRLKDAELQLLNIIEAVSPRGAFPS